MSMAAGEYVSVQSRADTEQADLAIERAELKADDKGEHKELMAICVASGLEPALARHVAEQLMIHDAIDAHVRDELGISETLRARPIQAALASAGSFAVGAAMPVLVTAGPGGGFDPSLSLELRWYSSRFSASWLHARAAQELRWEQYESRSRVRSPWH
jgi:hypothetical protein